MMAAAAFRVALIGDGVRESLTPALHVVEAAELGLDYRYDVIDLLELQHSGADIAHVLAEVDASGYDAVNVTHPVKQTVIPLLDDLSEQANIVGAVNLVLFRDGRRVGYNTDVSGFAGAFARGLPGVDHESVVQFGAGGAGAATAYSLLMAGTRSLAIVDQRLDAARVLVSRYRELVPDRDLIALRPDDAGQALADADGFVNATPFGMYIHPGAPIDVGLLRADSWVADVVYRPVRTQLIIAAQARGLDTLDGGGMALGQAVDSLRLITGVEPDAERMRAHLSRLIGSDHLAAR